MTSRMPSSEKSRGTPPPDVPQSEGDTNLTSRRAAWQERSLDAGTRALLAEDARYFLHQSVSTPCLNAIAKAEGIWIEDVGGPPLHGFPRQQRAPHRLRPSAPEEAIAEQMDALPFAPRRFTCEPAVALARKLAEISPGTLAKVLFTTGGSDAIEVALKIARAATGRFKTLSFWDAFHGAGFGAGGCRRRGAVPLRARRRRCCRAPSMWRRSPATAAPTAPTERRKPRASRLRRA